MKCRATHLAFSLSALAMFSGAQSRVEPPLPETASLIHQAILQQRLSESRERDYVFREDLGTNKLTQTCTWGTQCPGGPSGHGHAPAEFYVLASGGRHFEIFWLDGIRVGRVLPDRNWVGMTYATVKIPVSDNEFAVENQRVDKEIAEAEALRSQGKDASSPDDPPQILLSRLLELCTFSNPRRRLVEDRPTILLDFAWNPSAKPLSLNETMLRFISGTIGIDEEDRAVQHVEGRFLADAKLAGGKIRIRKGTRFTLENTRVDDGIWLLSNLDVWGQARYFSYTFNGEGRVLAGEYRKFQSEGKMLPALSERELSHPSHLLPNPLPRPSRLIERDD